MRETWASTFRNCGTGRPSQEHSAVMVNVAKPAAEAQPDLSVIIVNYNTHAVASKAIQSVLDHQGTLNLEIIVVDNDSHDGSIEAFRTSFPQITVLATGRNGGYAWGNNVGMRHARGRYLLVLNPDVLVFEGTLERAVSYMAENPEIGILGCHVSLENGAQQPTLFREVSLGKLFWSIMVPNRILRRSRLFGDQRYASLARNTVQDVEVVAGCFMMISRDVVERIGMMDDRFFMYSEESEWCWRVRQAGLKVRYNPDIRLLHYGAVSTGQTSPWKSVEIAKGHILFLRFTRGRLIAGLGTWLMATGDLIRAIWFLPLSLIRPDHKGAQAWRARFAFLLGALFRQPKGQIPPQPDIGMTG